MAGNKDKLGSPYENFEWPPADYEHPDQQYNPSCGPYIQQPQSSNTYQHQRQLANMNQQPQPVAMYQQQQQPANIYQQQPTNMYQQQQQQPTNMYQQQQQQPTNMYQQQQQQQQPTNMNQQDQLPNVYQQQQLSNMYQQQPAIMYHQQQQPMVFLQPVTSQPTSDPSTNVEVVKEVAGHQVIKKRGWRTGLCSCLADIGIGLTVCCFGSYASICCNLCGCFNISAMIMSCQLQESCCVPCCVGNYLVIMRTKVRAQLGIEGSMICDQCVICWCGMCAQCQMWREYKLARAAGEII